MKLNKIENIKLAHEYYLGNWLTEYEYDSYKKWLFKDVVIDILKSHIHKGLVLEIGCSRGFFLQEGKNQGYQTYGIDISLSSLKSGKKINPENNFIRGDGECIPFKNETFDAIVAIHSIEHMPNPLQVIQESFRMLKLNGILIIITPNKESIILNLFSRFMKYTSIKNPYHVSLMNREILYQHLIRKGFDCKITYFHNGFFCLPLLKIIKRDFLPLSWKLNIPQSHHLLAISIKNGNKKYD
jgi:SAM-dependent methyltransferase